MIKTEKGKRSYKGRMSDIELYYDPEQIDTEGLRKRLLEEGMDLGNADRDTLVEACYERQAEYGLGFDYVPRGTFGNKGGYYRYQLSWGGPQEEYRFFADPDGSLRRVEFWYLDWETGERIVLKDKEFALLKGVFEFFQEIGMTHIEK